MRFETVVEIAATAGHDRASVFTVADGIVIALADGAGGTSNAALAAEVVIDRARMGDCSTPWRDVLELVDQDPRLAGGQTTAVVLGVSADGIRGASVGDSGAWIVRGGAIDELTHAQRRKPLVGSGCEPVAFASGPLGGGTLLVASDGLLAYARRLDIAALVGGPDLAAAARGLVSLVRLRSGGLPDDVSIVLCRELTARA